MISTSFRVLQVNLNRNSTATESALQVAVELKVDLIVVQEPWTTTNVDHSFIRSILHPSFYSVTSNRRYAATSNPSLRG